MNAIFPEKKSLKMLLNKTNFIKDLKFNIKRACHTGYNGSTYCERTKQAIFSGISELVISSTNHLQAFTVVARHIRLK